MPRLAVARAPPRAVVAHSSISPPTRRTHPPTHRKNKSDAPAARLVAAAVPLLNAARLFVVGSGVARDPGLVASTARAGDRRELLGGPLCYVAVLAAATLLCWRDGPAALLVVAAMCGGDGLADVVGRRLGRGNPLPWNPDKSWAGSLAMFAGGYAMAMGCATAAGGGGVGCLS